MKRLYGLLPDENGQGMVEYAVILGFIAVTATAALALIGPKIKAIFDALH